MINKKACREPRQRRSSGNLELTRLELRQQRRLQDRIGMQTTSTRHAKSSIRRRPRRHSIVAEQRGPSLP